MTSYRVENIHKELLEQLLADSVLECFRSPPESSESSSTSGSAEEQGPPEAETEAALEVEGEEEAKSIVEEEASKVLPEIFPGPSLRHLYSDKIRAIEKENRIHVLPEEFKTEIDPQTIPKIVTTAQQKYIDILADMVGCTRYKSSLAEFWFLDTLANLLRRAQEDELDRPTQALLILWFCEWMKEMQHFDAADRKRMMRRFQDNMLSATRYLVEMDHLPSPAQAGVYYKARESSKDLHNTASVKTVTKSSSAHESKSKVRFGGSFECCVRDLVKIIHYIFDLSDYQYNLVRSVFTFSPDYALIDAAYQIQNPKKLYVPLKFKAKKGGGGSPRKDGKSQDSKKGKKGKEPLSEDYLLFLEKKAAAERILQEQEELEMEQWNLKNHILQLNKAVTEEFFEKYWPPPPPPPVEEIIPETPKGKGNKGAKGKK